MKTFLLILTFSLGAFAFAPSRAQDQEKADQKRLLAEEFLKLTGFEANGVNNALAGYRPVIEKYKAQGLPAGALAEIEAVATDYFKQVMSDPDLKKRVIDLYDKTFNEEELKALLAFYKTPVGRKALVEMPQIQSQSMSLGRIPAAKHAPAFQARLEAIFAKYKAGNKND